MKRHKEKAMQYATRFSNSGKDVLQSAFKSGDLHVAQTDVFRPKLIL